MPPKYKIPAIEEPIDTNTKDLASRGEGDFSEPTATVKTPGAPSVPVTPNLTTKSIFNGLPIEDRQRWKDAAKILGMKHVTIHNVDGRGNSLKNGKLTLHHSQVTNGNALKHFEKMAAAKILSENLKRAGITKHHLRSFKQIGFYNKADPTPKEYAFNRQNHPYNINNMGNNRKLLLDRDFAKNMHSTENLKYLEMLKQFLGVKK